MHTTAEKFYIEQSDDDSVDVLVIDRVSTEMSLTGKQSPSCYALLFIFKYISKIAVVLDAFKHQW
uniref:Uncharacterized protein n=1 Tax=Poecilia latipinna TaxID=48699 RepID=A0A3B3UWB5_9TELE